MKDVLENEITGGPVMVAIRGREHPLSYPMHAIILYKQQTLDSLFNPASWPKIDLHQDPERWLACLWAGLHQQQPDKSWQSPFSLAELEGLVDFGNAGEISVAMVKALTAFMPKKEVESKSPNEQGAAGSRKLEAPTSIESTPEPASVSA